MLAVEALGVTIGLATTDRRMLELLQTVWKSASVSSAGGAPEIVVQVPSGPTDAVLEHVSRLVTRAAIDARAGSLLLLHAAACILRSGDCVVLVGPSGAGKTTLVRQLSLEGARYLTDETVGIDEGGYVHPYVKPLSLVRQSSPHKLQVDPVDLGMRAATRERPRADRILLLARDPGRQRPAMCPLTEAQALVGLGEQSSQLRALRHPLSQLQSLVRSVGGVHKLTYGETTQVSLFLEASWT